MFSQLEFQIAWEGVFFFFFSVFFLFNWESLYLIIYFCVEWDFLPTYPVWKSPSLGLHHEGSSISYFDSSFSHDHTLRSVEEFYKWASIILVFFSAKEFYTLTLVHVQYLTIYLNVT